MTEIKLPKLTKQGG